MTDIHQETLEFLEKTKILFEVYAKIKKQEQEMMEAYVKELFKPNDGTIRKIWFSEEIRKTPGVQ